MALNSLGTALLRAGRSEGAVIAFQGDLTICREIGDRHGEAITMGNLGEAWQQAGRFAEAITAFQDAAPFPGDR